MWTKTDTVILVSFWMLPALCVGGRVVGLLAEEQRREGLMMNKHKKSQRDGRATRTACSVAHGRTGMTGRNLLRAAIALRENCSVRDLQNIMAGRC
jgi:hypothetical protein